MPRSLGAARLRRPRGEPLRSSPRVVSTARIASRMLRSGSTSRLAIDAAANCRPVAIRASLLRAVALVERDDGESDRHEGSDAKDAHEGTKAVQ